MIYIRKWQALIRLKYFVGIVIFALYPTYGLSQPAEEYLILEDLINEALERNPQLNSFYNVIRADSAIIPQSGALPDPILSLNLLNIPTNSFAFDQEAMTGKQIALRQKFPFPGKLGLKEKISTEKAGVSNANYLEFKNQIVKDVKVNYYDLFFVNKAIETTRKNQSLIQEFVKIAETKYAVGKGLQQDVLKAQVELSKMTDKIIQLEQRRKVIQARINTLLNRPVNLELGSPREPEFKAIEQNLDSLQNFATENRPFIQGWRAMKRQSDFKVRLAEKDYWPDLSLFVAYTQRDELQNGNPGYDFLSGGISLNIPIYSGQKQSKKVEEMKYNKIAVNERYNQIVNQVFFELEDKLTSADKNANLVELFKTGIIPQASQSLESALTGYQTDKVDFLTLINNQVTLFNYELDYYRVLSDYNKDIAQLEYSAGINFLTGKEY